MAVWDAAAKVAGLPLYRLLAQRLGRDANGDVRVYASGGYPYPSDDVARLRDELQRMRDAGYTEVKIEIGAAPIDADLRRIEAALTVFAAPHVAVDAMNAYDADRALDAAARLAPYGLRWFEDVCDPLDLATTRAVAAAYPPPIAAGEAMFSAQEAALLADHGGLRPDSRHPAVRPRALLRRSGFRAHRRHDGTARLAARRVLAARRAPLHAARRGGVRARRHELNPFSFAPFGGAGDDMRVEGGRVRIDERPGIGFEAQAGAFALFRSLVAPTAAR